MPNHLQHAVDVIEYLIVLESQDQKSGTFQSGRALRVRIDICGVLATVDLDNDHPVQANKIENVIPEGVLAPEFATIHLPRPETAPDETFGVGGCIAQPSLQPWFQDGAVGLAFH